MTKKRTIRRVAARGRGGARAGCAARFGEDYRVGVEWVGRCWAWLTEGEAPSLMEVVVSEAEVAKQLEPGQVRRVRAKERTIETAEGEVDGLELWAEFGAEPEPDLRATARGLWEGGKVRVPPDRPWLDEEGKIGTLLRFSMASVEVDRPPRRRC